MDVHFSNTLKLNILCLEKCIDFPKFRGHSYYIKDFCPAFLLIPLIKVDTFPAKMTEKWLLKSHKHLQKIYFCDELRGKLTSDHDNDNTQLHMYWLLRF